MSRCVLTVHGLIWMIGLGLVGWVALFAAAAVINRALQRKGPLHE